jgi:hypothetical protein
MIGSADITALAAERIVREILTGIALRCRGEADEAGRFRRSGASPAASSAPRATT